MDPLESAAYSEITHKVGSIRTARWHYIYNPAESMVSGKPYNTVQDERKNGYIIEKEELYDLASDPGEQSNVAKDHPEVAERLRNALIEWRGSQTSPTPAQDLDEETLQELRDLGYID